MISNIWFSGKLTQGLLSLKVRVEVRRRTVG